MGSIKKILPLSRIPLFILAHTLLGFVAIAQPTLPPREVTVNSTQALHFGSFCLQNIGSSGGTVTVDWQGTRTSTGQVLLLETAPAYQAAIFEVNLCQGRNIVITYSSTTTLAGSNGGSLTLNIGPTEKGVSGTAFQVNTDCSFITQIRVGGTLTVGSNTANPGGNYTGSFSITFNQQ
jgi:hypothetical protein